MLAEKPDNPANSVKLVVHIGQSDSQRTLQDIRTETKFNIDSSHFHLNVCPDFLAAE